MTSLILLLTAILLGCIAFPLGILFTLIECVRKGSKQKLLSYASLSFREAALGIDILGNVICRDMLNAFFIGRGGYHFGKQGETVSSALGKNQLKGTLTRAGRWLAAILDKIDPNHCINSIDSI